MSGPVVELQLMIHARSAKALLVSDSGDEEDAVWLPRSLIQITLEEGEQLEAEVPEWLALREGLI